MALGLGLALGLARGRSGSGSTPVYGLAATTAAAMGITPSMQYHPNTATMTMKADSTFSGYISQKVSSHIGTCTVLSVTAWSGITSAGVHEGSTISACSSPTNFTACTVLQHFDGSGNGGIGDYVIDMPFVANIGSSGSPVTFTMPAEQITNITDLMARADLSAADSSVGGGYYNAGPHLMVDAYGRKFLRFKAERGYLSNWLRNTVLTTIDNRNISTFMVGRIHNSTNIHPLVEQGCKENANGSTSTGQLLKVAAYGMPLMWSGSPYGAANQNKMVVGHQMCILGTASVTDDGIGGASTSSSNALEYIWHNEQSSARVTAGAGGRVTTTGFSVGINATTTPSSAGAGSFAYFDLYELVMCIDGQFGTKTANTIKAKGDAVVAALMANWNIPALTRSLTICGDSRTIYGSGPFVDYGANGTPSISQLLTEPGQPYCLPSDVRVINQAVGGTGIGRIHDLLFRPLNTQNWASGVTSTYQFGGGKDYASFFIGSNDFGIWPSTDGGTGGLYTDGRQTHGTNAHVDDMYWTGAANQPGGYPAYTATFSGTWSASSPDITYASQTGCVGNGSTISGGSLIPYSVSTVNRASTKYSTIANWSASSGSGVTVSAILNGYQFCVQTMLSRGIRVAWLAETDAPNSTNGDYFRGIIGTNAITDAGAGTGGAYAGQMVVGDLSQVKDGALYPFGANYGTYDRWHADQIHFTDRGRRLVVTGGDNPTYGYYYKLMQLLAL